MRLEYVDIERATPEQRAVIDTVASSPRGPIRGGPIGIWLHSPEFAQRAQHLGTFCRFQSTVPPLLSELTILICAAHWHAGYEWSSHLGPALKAGLSQDAADALRRGARPEFAEVDQKLVYRFVSELLCNKRIAPSTYTAARDHFGDRFLVDLAGIAGYYTMVALTLRAFEVEPATPVQFASDEAATSLASGPTGAAEAIEELELQRRSALGAGDAAKLAPLLGSDFCFVHSSGLTETKDSYLASVASGRITYRALNASDEVTDLFGDCAIRRGDLKMEIEIEGDPAHRNFRYTSLWSRASGEWKLLFWQNLLADLVA